MSGGRSGLGGDSLSLVVIHRWPPSLVFTPRNRPSGPRSRPSLPARDARVPRAGRQGLGIRDQGRMDPLARLHAAASTLTRLTGSCPRSSSLPSGPTPPASCAPPAAANPGIRRVGCGDGRLLTERERSVPRGRTALFSPT